MKMTKYVLRYGEKRSVNYQSIDISGEITIELEPGDDIREAHSTALKQLVQKVRQDADRAIERYQ